MPATLNSRIPLMVANLEPQALEGLKELAEQIAEEARNRVPVRTGSLRDAIHVEVDGNEVTVIAGDDDAWYGHIVERGSVIGSPPQPFLVPAFELARADLEKILAEKLEDL